MNTTATSLVVFFQYWNEMLFLGTYCNLLEVRFKIKKDTEVTT